MENEDESIARRREQWRRASARRRLKNKSNGNCRTCGRDLRSSERVICSRCRLIKHLRDNITGVSSRQKTILDFGGKCSICGATQVLVFDHIYDDGYSDKVNVSLYKRADPAKHRLLCPSCNALKAVMKKRRDSVRKAVNDANELLSRGDITEDEYHRIFSMIMKYAKIPYV